MNKQIEHSLIEAAFGWSMAAVVALTGWLPLELSGRALVVALVASLTPALKRVYEGYKDGIRAEEGAVLSRDVGAKVPPPPRTI